MEKPAYHDDIVRHLTDLLEWSTVQYLEGRLGVSRYTTTLEAASHHAHFYDSEIWPRVCAGMVARGRRQFAEYQRRFHASR